MALCVLEVLLPANCLSGKVAPIQKVRADMNIKGLDVGRGVIVQGCVLSPVIGYSRKGCCRTIQQVP